MTADRVRAVTVVERTSNAKLGDCSATYVAQHSCPPDCPFLGSGCYAEHGPLGWQTQRLNRSPPLSPVALARQEGRLILTLTGARLLRLHVVGDCRTPAAARILGHAATLFTGCAEHRQEARAAFEQIRAVRQRGRQVWTYTHAWRRVPRAAWGPDVSVLASCETPAHVTAASRRGYAAALVVPFFERESADPLPEGIRLLPCPEQTRGLTCAECRLCLDDGRLLRANLTMGFTPHGVGANRIRQALPAVPPPLPSDSTTKEYL